MQSRSVIPDGSSPLLVLRSAGNILASEEGQDRERLSYSICGVGGFGQIRNAEEHEIICILSNVQAMQLITVQCKTLPLKCSAQASFTLQRVLTFLQFSLRETFSHTRLHRNPHAASVLRPIPRSRAPPSSFSSDPVLPSTRRTPVYKAQRPPRRRSHQ